MNSSVDFGINLRTSIAILNCLLARQLCFEDASCSAILEIIPRVCGSELVACSTVTVTKCQAALRTLQAFPFFKPTCLCREPNVDPECNLFRDFLFDHPCVFVSKKEKDPYPVETLPTCTYALNVCHNEPTCMAIFDGFKSACRVRDGECRMEDRDLCKESWSTLRMSPLFGCICPNNHMKKRCDRIFSIVNNNPCVDLECHPSVITLFVSGSRTPPKQNGLTRYTAPDGTLLLLTDEGTRLLTRDAAADLLRHALYSPHAVKLISDGKGGNLTSVGWYGGITQQEENLISPNYVIQHISRYKTPHFRIEGRIGTDPGDESNSNKIGSPKQRDDDRIRFNMQSTCHVALDTCLKTIECADVLTPVLQQCGDHDCERESCMSALRGFYRVPDVKWNIEIAFCLCKKTDTDTTSCISAQERLHPSCAQKSTVEVGLPGCHTLAQDCREDGECREHLEDYEQWCAVDSVTHGCAGPPASCRKAVAGLLGTSLRSACACRGTDFAQLNDCLVWQRLLWLNPCVVEAQSDYHIKTYGLVTSSPPSEVNIKYITTPERPKSTIVHTTSEQDITPPQYKKKPIPILEKTTLAPTEEIVETAVDEITTSATSKLTTTTSTTTTTVPTTTTTSTTTLQPITKVTTTTEPPKYCVVQWEDHEDQYIKMGETKRLSRSSGSPGLGSSSSISGIGAECAEVCACGSALRVSCSAACVPRAPCESRLAHYSHAAPAYRAYRGRCYCYSGAFICMRPEPGEYFLPTGVYLLLGYSSVDETLLRPYTGLGIEDAVRFIQKYMDSLSGVKNSCTLSLFNVSTENVIIQATLPPNILLELKNSSIPILNREKEECIDPLNELKLRINSQHDDIVTHLLLSIFKIAEVDVVYPAVASSATSSYNINILILSIAIVILAYKSNKDSIIQVLDEFINKSCSSNDVQCIEKYFLDDLMLVDRDDIFIDDIECTIYNAPYIVREHNAYKVNVNAQSFNVIEIKINTKSKHIVKAVRVTIFVDNFYNLDNYFSNVFDRCTTNTNNNGVDVQVMLFDDVLFLNDKSRLFLMVNLA